MQPCIECKKLILASSEVCQFCGAPQLRHDLETAPAWEASENYKGKQSVCPECGGERVESDVLNSQETGNPYPNLWVAKPRNPAYPSNNKTTRIKAMICGGCGLTTLFAQNPALFKTRAATEESNFEGTAARLKLIELAEQIFGSKADRIVSLLEKSSPDIEALYATINQAQQIAIVLISKNLATLFYERAMRILDGKTSK